MLIDWILIIIGIFFLYLVIDFLLLRGADVNKFGEKWIVRTLWLWLPIYGLWRLTKEVILKKK
jgi:hypothetical protein